VTDKEWEEEIAQLATDRRACKNGREYRLWREKCHRVFREVVESVAESLVTHGYHPARLRRTPDHLLLMLPCVGPVALARIRATFPYEAPTADNHVPDEWVIADLRLRYMAKKRLRDRAAERRAEEKRRVEERQRNRHLTSFVFPIRIPLNGDPLDVGHAPEIIAAAARATDGEDFIREVRKELGR